MSIRSISFDKSLKGRLLAALVFIALISIGGLGLAAYLNQRSALEAEVAAQLTSVADLKKEQIITWLKECQGDARFLAVNKLNQNHFTQILSPQTSADQKITLVTYLTDELISLQQSRVGYSEITFVDTDGTVILSTEPAYVDQPTQHQMVFAETLAAPDGTFVHDIHSDSDSGLIEMEFGHVVNALDLNTGEELPEVIGVAFIAVNMKETIYPLIRAWPGIGETGETFLIRAEGDTTLALNNLRFNEDAALKLRLPANSPNAKPAHFSSRGSEGIIQTPDYRGVPVLAAYRHIPSIGWGLVAKKDLNEAFAPINVLARRIGLVAVVVLAVAGLASVVISRTLTRPLAQLVEGTRAVAAGNLAIEIDVVRQDEVGLLANSFNQMTSQLKQTLEGLKQHVAELELAEVALRESEEHFRSVAQTANEAIISSDSRGNIIFWNKGAEIIFGYSSDEAIGQPVTMLMPKRFHQAHRSGLERVVSTRQTKITVDTTELTGLRKDGSEFPLELSLATWEREEGVFFTGIARDITERKHLEAQLRQSQKMEAIGQLAGGIAHDFNNLLTVISGHSALLLPRLEESDLRHDVEQIKKAGERAASLTRQLLAFSRKQILQPTVLDLNGIVADVEKMLQRLIGEDIGLVTVLDTELDLVKADPGQMEQVILNLAVNARDAMPWGGKLSIETANVFLDETYTRQHVGVEPGSYVMLAVSDTGVGMDEETLSHVFEPFFTTKDEDKGTGLGLATIYGIVKQSNGHIWVYSEPGQGTVFKIYLPRLEAPVVTSNVLTKRAKSSPRGSETILLVEDEEQVRTLARRILQKNDYTVLEAYHGKEALQICEQYKDPIHMVLTDVVMPGGMSGRELAERLVLLRPEIKVLYMSGYTDSAVVHHGVLSLNTAFIQKPFTVDALTNKVRDVLDGQIGTKNSGQRREGIF